MSRQTDDTTHRDLSAGRLTAGHTLRRWSQSLPFVFLGDVKAKLCE